MSDAPTLIYLEADDEITGVVRRVRAAEEARVVIVAPGRSRATSSTVALRLLARAAEEDGRQVAIVGDALTRSLAAEAGLTAYGSVADARRADPGETPVPGETRTAAIHVVRGSPGDDTAPTLMAVAATDEAQTRAHPVTPAPAPPPRRRAPPRRPARRRLSVATALAGLAIVLVAWGAIGAIVLPAATIAITPRSEAIGPSTEAIAVTDVEHLNGTVTETATVTATGTYDIEETAAGRVTFFNFNFFDVVVPAESLVATGRDEGDQAFMTIEAIRVPAGTFDPFQGGITAGEGSVGIVAAAIGPNGNVAAEAIDTILDGGLEGQLRGFPSITERLVVNPEPTTGGSAGSGVEITQEDVEAATAELRQALQDAVDEALAGSDALLFADPDAPVEAQIEGLDDLVGMRDSETVEIRGSLTYDRLTADPADVEAIAIERFRSDASFVPAGWQLIEDATRVVLGEVARVGDGLTVQVTVNGRVTPVIDRNAVIRLVIGSSARDAEGVLSELGSATVELWPFWVGTVPDREWRIEVDVVGSDGGESDQ
ncbi:MAG TPA: hypothetical protein VI277_05495 [Candidatus Limnocylindria bacterium]